MSIFKVSAVTPEPKEWASNNGVMLSYYIRGSFDGGAEEQAQINTTKAKPKVPYIGEEIDCVVAKEHPQYGKTLKRTPPAQGGFGGPSQGFTPRPEDPARQDSIIRQSSFERAILIQSTKAQIFIAEKKYTEAHDTMKFKTITDLSDYIADYAKGQLINPPKVTEEDINNFPIDDGPYGDEQ